MTYKPLTSDHAPGGRPDFSAGPSRRPVDNIRICDGCAKEISLVPSPILPGTHYPTTNEDLCHPCANGGSDLTSDKLDQQAINRARKAAHLGQAYGLSRKGAIGDGRVAQGDLAKITQSVVKALTQLAVKQALDKIYEKMPVDYFTITNELTGKTVDLGPGHISFHEIEDS